MKAVIREAKATVIVSDMDRAIRFYTKVLGLRLKVQYGGWWAEITAPGLTIALHPATGRGLRPGKAGSISLAFQVPDIDKAVASLAKHGVKSKVREGGFVRQADFKDPDGTPLYFAEVRRTKS